MDPDGDPPEAAIHAYAYALRVPVSEVLAMDAGDYLDAQAYWTGRLAGEQARRR